MVDWNAVTGSGGAPAAPAPAAKGVDWGSVTGGGLTPVTPGQPNVGLQGVKAAAPKGKGGGGLLGFIGKEAKTGLGMVTGIPKGLGQLGKDLGRATVDTGEKAANTVASPFTDNRIGGDAYARDTTYSRQAALAELHDLPAVKGMIRGGLQTGRHIVGNAQLLAHAATEPLALSLKASGNAGAAKAVANPLGHGFEDQLVKDYKANPLAAGVNDAANLSIAAGPLAAGADLAGAGGAADALRGVGHVAGKVAGAPVEPWLRTGGAGLGALADAHPAVGAALGHVGRIADAINNGRAGKMYQESSIHGEVQPRDIARDTENTYRKLPANDHEFGAGVLRAKAQQNLLAPLLDHPEAQDVLDSTLARMGARNTPPTEEAIRQSIAPNENAKAAEEAVRSVRANAETRNAKGFGMVPGKTLDEAQTRYEPIPAAVEKEIAPLAKAHESAKAELFKLNEQNATEPEKAFARAKVQQAASRLEEGTVAAQKNVENWPAMVRDNAKLAQQAIDELTGRTKTGARNEGTTSEPNVQNRNNVEAFRTPEAQAAREAIAAKLQPMTDPHYWANLPPEARPVHVIGDAVDENAPGKGSSGGSSSRFRNLKASNQREGAATAYTKEGQIKLEQSELARGARNLALSHLMDQHAVTPRSLLGDSVDSMDHHEINQAMQTALADKAVGYKPINLSARDSNGLSVEQPTGDTRFVPEPVFNALSKSWQPEIPANLTEHVSGMAGKAVDAVTRYAYRNFLALEPSYIARRLVGNEAMLLANGVPAETHLDLIRRAREALKNDQAPAVITDRLNSEPTNVGDKVSRVMQTAPRYLDTLQREMLFLHFRDQGMSYEDAATKAMTATGAGPASDVERNVLQRLVPGFSWGKTVGEAGLNLARANPSVALQALNLGQMASKKGSGFSNEGAVGELNPLSIFSLGGGGINPVVRGAFGAGTGYNLAKIGQKNADVTRPPQGSKPAPLTAQEREYFALNQLPAFKLFEQSPLSKQNQDYGHYQTGELEKSGKKPLPAYVPPTHTPGGTFGSAWAQAVGFPSSPKQNAAGKIAAKKIAASAAKSKAKDAAIRKALAKRGIR